MLQDKYLPRADIKKSHTIEINAPVDKVYAAMENFNLAQPRVINWLFKLRGIPVHKELTLKHLEKIGFIRLETITAKEIVIGIIGQFWSPTGKLQKVEPEAFVHIFNAGYAKAIWNFEFEKIGEFKTRLTTETRIYCPDRSTRFRFKVYWSIISPFSSWIRKEILKSVKTQSEK